MFRHILHQNYVAKGYEQCIKKQHIGKVKTTNAQCVANLIFF